VTRIRLSEDWADDGWTRVPRSVARDSRLSWKARGLVLFLASHKPGFELNHEFLINAAKDGETSLESGLAELREAGYLEVVRERNDAGHLGDSLYVLHRAPCSGVSPEQVGSCSGVSQDQENPRRGKSGTKGDQPKERAPEQETTTAPEGASTVTDLPAALETQGPRDANEEGLTVNQRATRLAQDHYDALGRMGNVPAWVKIIRKALEHGFTPDQTRQALDWIGEHNWTLTEERLANTLKGGPRKPTSTPPQTGPPRSSHAGTRPAGAQSPRRSAVQGV
jgi:hypothetical protein